MNEEEYFRKNYPDYCYGGKPLSPHWDFFQDGVEFGERESEKRITELEKENTELNEKVNILDNCDRLGDMITEAYKEQLTKAKELLKKLLSAYISYADSFDDRDNQIVEEAEQFLSEVGK